MAPFPFERCALANLIDLIVAARSPRENQSVHVSAE